MTHRTYKTAGIVLKRRNFGEADRIITLFSQHHGKIIALAKGVRRITSRRAAALEPATQSVFFFTRAKTWDILTQAQLINSFTRARRNLARVTQTYQVLEIIDLLTRENQSHPEIYDLLVDTLDSLNQSGNKRHLLVNNIRHLVNLLGFGVPQDNSEIALKHHIEAIADRSLRTKAILHSHTSS